MKNNEIRNILLHLNDLEKKLEKEGILDNFDIKYNINSIYERIGYMLDDMESDVNYLNDIIGKNKELISYLNKFKGGNENEIL